MRYIIHSVDIWPYDKDATTKLLKTFPCLEDFGYETEFDDGGRGTSYIHINDVSDFTRLINRVGHPIILSDDPACIEIYDNYRE